MDIYKKGEVLKVNYLALKKTEGLTDVTMYVYNPSDVLVNTVVMTEVVAESGMDALGLYRGSFTPALEGQYRVRIESATNGDDISKVFEIGNFKLDDLDAQLVTIDGKIDNLDADVVAVKGVVDSTEGKVDGLVVDVAAVKGVVDGIVTDVAAVKGVVDTTDGKVDNLDADVVAVKGVVDATKLVVDATKIVVDSIDAQISQGGYIL